MPPPSTLYRFQIELSDIDRGVYETLDFRAAQHPSENALYLVTRVLALALNAQDGLAFTPEGLSDPDAPALRSLDANGTVDLWIEIGNPNPRKLHKAAKTARQVKVYTYKDAEMLLREMRKEEVHRLEEIEVFSLAPKFLEALAARLERNNAWTLLHNEGSLTLGMGEHSETGEITRHASAG